MLERVAASSEARRLKMLSDELGRERELGLRGEEVKEVEADRD